MGWGCYKHEWDAGSEAWQEFMSELCERMLQADDRTWGRDGEVCPKCWADLVARAEQAEAQVATLRVALESLRAKLRPDGRTP